MKRRDFLGATGAALLTSKAALAGDAQSQDTDNADAAPVMVPYVISSFRTRDWQPYFKNLNKGAILADTESRIVHYWHWDHKTYLLYPCSVPQTDELTRRGRTSVIQKVVGPTWRPTASMRERHPEYPEVMGPGPDNPLGPFALYLGWPAYRIHGTHDTRKIGRRSSSGCIGLYNPDITRLFGLAQVGTQVLLV